MTILEGKSYRLIIKTRRPLQRGFFVSTAIYKRVKYRAFYVSGFTYFYTMNLSEIKQVIFPVLKKHKVTKAGIFGSYAKNNFTEDSDIDILVEHTYPMSLLDFIGIKLELEDMLKKSVDLVEYKAIKPVIKENILNSEVRIYG